MANFMNSIELIRLSLELEHIIDANGDLRPRPGKEPALLEVSQYTDGHILHFWHEIPGALRAQLVDLDIDLLLNDHERVKAILSAYKPCSQIFAGIGCYFAHTPLAAEFPDVVFHNGCYVVMVDDQPVCWAWTQDQSPNACELAVETLPAYQRRGYGRQVVAAWAAHVRNAGQVAFYSYRVSNTASAALARRLGVLQYARKTAYA